MKWLAAYFISVSCCLGLWGFARSVFGYEAGTYTWILAMLLSGGSYLLIRKAMD